VKNNPEDDSFLIDVPVGDNSEQIRYSRCTPIDRTGKPNPIQCLRPQEASTQVKVLEYGTYKGKPCTKLLLKPLTGRRHQLRVHMQYLGYPIVGDLCYGVEDFETYRTMLHAYRLKIKIDTKERMFVKAKANDPFLNDIDADWKPDRILHRLDQLKI
jgi:23S rRNA-/tRNA-specific pseudouridylate synthase